MKLKNIKKPDHNLIALCGVSAGLIAMTLTRDWESLALVAGILMLMASLFLSEDMLCALRNFFNKPFWQNRKTLDRIKKTLSDFNKANESRYTSFSDSAVNLKRSIKNKKMQRRAEFGKISALFGWEEPETKKAPQTSKHVNPVFKRPALSFGANQLLKLRCPPNIFTATNGIRYALINGVTIRLAVQPSRPAAHMLKQDVVTKFNEAIQVPLAENTENLLTDAFMKQSEEDIRQTPDPAPSNGFKRIG